MKLIIRICLLCIALSCFSNLLIAQKKNKKKAKTSVISKKKKPIKKSTTKTLKGKKNKKSYKSNKSNNFNISNKSSKNNKSYNSNNSNNNSYSNSTFNTLSDNTENALSSKLENNTPISLITVVKKNDTTPDKVVSIISAFKPQLKNIAKIGFTNATSIVDTNSIMLMYQVPSQNLSFQYQPIALVPRAIKIDSLNTVSNSTSFKIGLGNYFNQYLQAQHAFEDRNNNNHSVNIKNESIAGFHPLQKWNGFDLNYLGAYEFNKSKKLNTQLYFNQSSSYRYGLVPDTTKLPLDNFSQKFSVIGANFSLVNKTDKTNIIYFAPILKFNRGNLLRQASDINIELNSPIYYNNRKNIGFQSDINVGFNQYNLLNKTVQNNYFVQIEPSIVIKKSNFKLLVGARPTYLNSTFLIYPNIELVKKLKDTNYILSSGWKTTLFNNQLVQLMHQNQWIAAPGALPVSTIESKYFQLNITGSKRLNYKLHLTLNDYRDIPFFNPTRQANIPLKEGLKFDVLFEKRAIAIEFMGDIRYQFSDKLLWNNKLKYIQFNLIRENLQPWGVLPIEINSQLYWMYNKHINFDASGQFWTGSKTSSGLAEAYQLNNAFVVNLGMQYAFTKNWMFWAKGENLLNQQYQRWANYPSLGIQFLAGLQYKFSK